MCVNPHSCIFQRSIQLVGLPVLANGEGKQCRGGPPCCCLMGGAGGVQQTKSFIVACKPAAQSELHWCTACTRPMGMRGWARSRCSLGQRALVPCMLAPGRGPYTTSTANALPCRAPPWRWGTKQTHRCAQRPRMHASMRQQHPPPLPDGSPHAFRTQASLLDHISTIHAPWWAGG